MLKYLLADRVTRGDNAIGSKSCFIITNIRHAYRNELD